MQKKTNIQISIRDNIYITDPFIYLLTVPEAVLSWHPWT